MALGVTQSARFDPWAVLDFMVLAVAVNTVRILIALLAVAFRNPHPAATVTNGFSAGHVAGLV